MSRSELNVSRWLEAHSDRSANLKTLPRNAIFSDASGDGYYRLILTDLKLETSGKSRLKSYKGTLLTSDLPLQEVPSGVISFYTDQAEARIPAIAVACGHELLMFKNNKPFFKFTIPPCTILPVEIELWEEKLFGEQRNEALNTLRTIPFQSLTSRSQILLGLKGNEIDDYLNKFKGVKLVKFAPITCLDVLFKTSPDRQSISCPVLATETGQVFVLDPQTFGVLHQANVCSLKATPFIIKTLGLYDVDFRLIIACREKLVCVIRRGWLEGKLLIQLTCDVVDLVVVPGDNFIVVATTDQTLHCYTKRGQRLWSNKLNSLITCLCLVPLAHLSTHLIAVGLKGGMVHLYQGRSPVDFTSVPDSPSTIVFGQLGQEEHVLCIITIAGTLNFKILKRTADFNLHNQDMHSNPALQSKPLPLPKRSKLFLEQSQREKLNAIEMHQNFQQDLIRLRLTTARTLVQTLTQQSGFGNEKEQIKLSAQVLGLGPKFTMILTLDNMHDNRAVLGFSLIFHVDPKIYTLSNYLSKIPLIPPSLSYKLETRVEEVSSEEVALPKLIRVFVTKLGVVQPVLAATINMPATEL